MRDQRGADGTGQFTALSEMSEAVKHDARAAFDVFYVRFALLRGLRYNPAKGGDDVVSDTGDGVLVKRSMLGQAQVMSLIHISPQMLRIGLRKTPRPTGKAGRYDST